MAKLLTVAQINERILQLRSRIAMFETLMTYVETNYVSSNDIEAELRFLRDDGAAVSQDHVQDGLTYIVESLDQARAEIEKLEGTPLQPEPEPVEEKPAEGQAELPAEAEPATAQETPTETVTEETVVPLKKETPDAAQPARRGTARASAG